MDFFETVNAAIKANVPNIFETMLSLQLEHLTEPGKEFTTPFSLTGVVGTISMTGGMTGVVYFNLNEALALKLSQKIMGTEDDVPAHEQNDVVGELTNMMTGSLKNYMSGKGYDCALSIPTVLRAQNINVSGKGTTLAILKSFEVKGMGDRFDVRVLARLND